MLQAQKKVHISSAEGLTYKNEDSSPVSATKQRNYRN
jgi:hypothetical protein